MQIKKKKFNKLRLRVFMTGSVVYWAWRFDGNKLNGRRHITHSSISVPLLIRQHSKLRERSSLFIHKHASSLWQVPTWICSPIGYCGIRDLPLFSPCGQILVCFMSRLTGLSPMIHWLTLSARCDISILRWPWSIWSYFFFLCEENHTSQCQHTLK